MRGEVEKETPEKEMDLDAFFRRHKSQGCANQPISSGILTQSSRYKRAESNLIADEKGLQLSGYTIYIYIFILIVWELQF